MFLNTIERISVEEIVDKMHLTQKIPLKIRLYYSCVLCRM